MSLVPYLWVRVLKPGGTLLISKRAMICPMSPGPHDTWLPLPAGSEAAGAAPSSRLEMVWMESGSTREFGQWAPENESVRVLALRLSFCANGNVG